jgi:hypothetical protein
MHGGWRAGGGRDAIAAMKRVLLLTMILAGAAAAEPRFVPLFDGKSLQGWEVCNGKASYKVEGGAIVGTTVEGSPNSFLCTTREYGDFELEFEVKVDPALNSGVQIRSHQYPKDTTVNFWEGGKKTQHVEKAGRFYGYQVEISTTAEGTSGGVYDEARRGWIDNIASNPEAGKAFKDNEWNRYRIVAVGDSIRTWVNGVPCANLVDPLDLSGYIGLQVHAFKGDKPAQVRWRDIKIKDLGRHIWKPLWNGSNFDGWRTQGGGQWKVEDGAIHGISLPDDPRIGFLVTDGQFKDVTAQVRFKIVRGNSGFFLRSEKETMAGYEVEIDEGKRTGGFWEVGGRNWVTGPDDNAVVEASEWNDVVASLHGHKIVFFVNGVKTVDLPDDIKGRMEGNIALQIHGSKRPTEIWFKDVAILTPQE